jgi:dehydrogenase/reductase SDR family member 4
VRVIVSSRDKKHIDETVTELKAKGLEAHGVVCHVGKAEDRQRLVRETVAKYGQLNYLVLNAAVSTQMGSFL